MNWIKAPFQIFRSAKRYTKNEKIVFKNAERKIPLYNDWVVIVIITQVVVEIFSLPEEE